MTQEFVLTKLSVSGDNEAYAGFEERGFALPDRLDAVRHRWAMERHDLMAAARWADANQRTEAKHTRDDRLNADPASA